MPRRAVVGQTRLREPEREHKRDLATCRGRVARHAVAEGQSAEGIVDEKSVGKIPRTDAGPSKAGKVGGSDWTAKW